MRADYEFSCKTDFIVEIPFITTNFQNTNSIFWRLKEDRDYVDCWCLFTFQLVRIEYGLSRWCMGRNSWKEDFSDEILWNSGINFFITDYLQLPSTMPKQKKRKSIFGRKTSSAKRSHEWRQSQNAEDLRKNEAERKKISR